MADRNAYGQPQVGNQGFARTVKVLGGAVALLATDLALNRTTALFVAPKGFVLTGIDVTVTDLDTNGSPAILITVGDAGDDDRFLASSNIGQAGGNSTTLAAAGKFYEFTADTEIVLKVPTAAATAAAGTITAYFTGFMK